MEIDIKFKLNDHAWLIEANKVTQIRVVALKIECLYNGYSANNWGETTISNGGYPFKIWYNEDPYGKKEWINQTRLFPTKEELLKSL